jgi:hypothetical protein
LYNNYLKQDPIYNHPFIVEFDPRKSDAPPWLQKFNLEIPPKTVYNHQLESTKTFFFFAEIKAQKPDQKLTPCIYV